jgi:hypothetical protein
MAKSVKRTRAEAPQEEITVKARVDVTESTPIVYINFAEVAHSRHEFSIICARTPTKPDFTVIELAKTSGVYPIEASTVLIVPPSLMRGMIRAMQTQMDKYEQSFGKISGEEPTDG